MMVKDRIMTMMRRMMLNCEEASYISTRKVIEGVGFKDSMNLRMHLAACKHCKNSYLQTRIIAGNIRYFSSLNGNGTPLHRMSAAEKSRLQKIISNKIKTN